MVAWFRCRFGKRPSASPEAGRALPSARFIICLTEGYACSNTRVIGVIKSTSAGISAPCQVLYIHIRLGKEAYFI